MIAIQKPVSNAADKYRQRGASGQLPSDIKLCPFQSSPDKEVACNSRCVLFRQGKQRGYACPMSEMTSVSYMLRLLADRKIGK